MLKLLTVAAFGLACASGAQAAGVCTGAAPEAGAVLHGPVLHVEEGGRLCVAKGFGRDQWVELQLADAPPELARGPLMSAAFAKDVDCKVRADGRAVCTVEGQSVSDLAQRPSVQKADLSWR